MSDSEYEHINNAINGMIGQLTVPMMKFRDPDIKEVHARLLELAAWLDDNVNEAVACEHGNGPDCLQCVVELDTITTEQLADDMQITVCSHCRQASCWLGEFYCDQYKQAGTLHISVGQLRIMGLEHPDYWAKEIRSRHGRP